MLPEHIINEESDECSEGSINSNDDSDDSEICDDSYIQKGSLQGSQHVTIFIPIIY